MREPQSPRELVDYTLWRDGVLLGRMRIPFPTDDDSIFGMLEVEPAFTDIDEMMQSRLSLFPGSPIVQNLTKDAHPGPGPIALQPMTPELQRGTPPERVLELRDATGETHIPRMLIIWRTPDDHMGRGELFDICQERGITMSPWILSAQLPDS